MTETIITQSLLGLALGDALGVPAEFSSRHNLDASPITGMSGYGTHNKPPGTWSDDTSLTLALADSLAQGHLDYRDIMRRSANWLLKGAYTADGETFDVGSTTREAIHRFVSGAGPLSCGRTSERDNGNGSLMRILPLVFYVQAHYDKVLSRESVDIIHNVSALTHAHPRSKVACVMYLAIADGMLRGKDIYKAVRSALKGVKRYYGNNNPYADELSHFNCMTIAHENTDTNGSDWEFTKLPRHAIESSGYVVDTLDATIWCMLNHEGYKDTVLAAVNLGRDSDTTGAVCGGLAGLYYCEELGAIAQRESISSNKVMMLNPEGKHATGDSASESVLNDKTTSTHEGAALANTKLGIPEEWTETLVNRSLVLDISKRFSESLKQERKTRT